MMPLHLQPFLQEDLEQHLNRAAEEDELELVMAMLNGGVHWTRETMVCAIRGAHRTGHYRTLHWLIQNGCPPIAEHTRME
jgi:hypothetical protein